MNRWVFCFIFLYHFFLFGQKSREQIDLLNQIISKRENHILNKSKSIKWQEYNQSLLTSDVDKITKLFDTIWRNKEKGLADKMLITIFILSGLTQPVQGSILHKTSMILRR